MLLRSARVRRFLDLLLHTHDTPQRTAAAYGLGVFFGFSPFLGAHTILGLLFAFTCRLNRVAVMLGVYSNLPWILAAYSPLPTILGATLLGVDAPPGLRQNLTAAFRDASWGEFRSLARALMPLAWAYALGSIVGAVILGALAYRMALAMVIAHRKHPIHLPHLHDK